MVSLGPAHRVTSKLGAVTFISRASTAAAFFPASDVAVTPEEPPPVPGCHRRIRGGTTPDRPQLRLWFPSRTRVDVFAVGSDNALWHKWLDSKGWHGENIGYETGNWDLRGGSLLRAVAGCAESRGDGDRDAAGNLQQHAGSAY